MKIRKLLNVKLIISSFKKKGKKLLKSIPFVLKYLKRNSVFILFLLLSVFLIWFDYQINMIPKESPEKMKGFIMDFFCLNYFDIEEQILQYIIKTFQNVLDFRIYALVSCSLISTAISAFIKRYADNQVIKIFGISPKCYSHYYSRIYKIRISIILICVAALLKARITLLFICICLLFYSLSMLLLYDYTMEVKMGIKKGYFRYVKSCEQLHNNNHNFLLNLLITIQKYFIKDETILLYERSDNLLEELIIHSVDTSSQNDYMENYDVLKFVLEILSEFYKQLNNQNIELFIRQIHKCINAFFILEGKTGKNFEYFVSAFSGMLFQKSNEQLRYYDNAILMCLFIMVYDTQLSNNKKREYIEIIKMKTSFSTYMDNYIIAHSIYIYMFFKCILEQKLSSQYYLFKYTFRKIQINGHLDYKQLLLVYKLSKIAVHTFYFYYPKIQTNFDYLFLLLIQYFGNDLMTMYFKYEEEVN